MEITLNHTIVPSKNNVESAKFYEKIFGFKFIKELGHFAVVKVNSTLTLDFDTRDHFSKNHYAFKVDDEQFDKIFKRIKIDNIDFGSGPYSDKDGKINNRYGGRGVYFRDLNGHLLEILTADIED
ncbi:VOC family protein [Fusobacteria bacterium ZRK30]|nr:VOC family protein [Fusobacteria bacterium ZRK30]